MSKLNQNQNQKKISLFRIIFCGWLGFIIGLWIGGPFISFIAKELKIFENLYYLRYHFHLRHYFVKYYYSKRLPEFSPAILAILGCILGYYWRGKPKSKEIPEITVFQIIITVIGWLVLWRVLGSPIIFATIFALTTLSCILGYYWRVKPKSKEITMPQAVSSVVGITGIIGWLALFHIAISWFIGGMLLHELGFRAIFPPILAILGCAVSYLWKVKPESKEITGVPIFQAIIIVIGWLALLRLDFYIATTTAFIPIAVLGCILGYFWRAKLESIRAVSQVAINTY